MDWNSIIANCYEDVPVNGATVQKVATLDCLPAVFQNLVNAALIFAGVVAVIFIIISGLKFITSGGDAKQIEGARHTLTYAIIGLIIILLSFMMINLIAGITGAQCIKMFGFSSCQ